ncbi:hypothetical protein ACFU6I_34505 [Streptomyces sp. NPDC057486]|uniref:hypothetical protein n=1 Tax=Streptomyces sp. NPDC057486 TaxID=3346145 RepID=UPI0036D136F9
MERAAVFGRAGLNAYRMRRPGAFLAAGGAEQARQALAAGELPLLNGDGLRIGAPVALPGKIVCVGLNYRDCAAETGAPYPSGPSCS